MKIDTQVQLALDIKIPSEFSFANYCAKNNQEVFAFIKQLARGDVNAANAYIWGGAGVGKTHLLLAASYAAIKNDLSAIYLPLAEAATFEPQSVHDLNNLRLVCLDDFDAVIGDARWEEELFYLFNKLNDRGSLLLIASSCSIHELTFKLPDLKSRIGSCVAFYLNESSDEGKISALQLHAKARGLYLSYAAGRYLLSRYKRDNQTLFSILDKLDQLLLERGKGEVTIPFIKSVLE